MQVSIDESIIKSDYEIDSIVIIEILVALESEFDIEFADGELIPDTLESVRSLTETVFRHICDCSFGFPVVIFLSFGGKG